MEMNEGRDEHIVIQKLAHRVEVIGPCLSIKLGKFNAQPFDSQFWIRTITSAALEHVLNDFVRNLEEREVHIQKKMMNKHER